MIFALDSANRRIYLIWWIKVFGDKWDSSFCESKKKQKLLKDSCEAPENSPASWCKKSDSKGAEVQPFLRKESSELSGEGSAESKSFGKLKLIR